MIEITKSAAKEEAVILFELMRKHMSKTFFKINILLGKFKRKVAIAKGFRPKEEEEPPSI